MQRISTIAAILAAAFALPLAAYAAGGDKQSGSKSASAQTQAGNGDGGAEAMFKAMDKNGDGNISKEEATGTPHHADFATLDKDSDGKLSREEHAEAPEHVAARSGGGKSGSASGGSSGSKKSY